MPSPANRVDHGDLLLLHHPDREPALLAVAVGRGLQGGPVEDPGRVVEVDAVLGGVRQALPLAPLELQRLARI